MDINIERLTKIYEKRAILDIKSLTFDSNKFYGIIGPNGAGKSTLLKILSGLEPQTSGEILYNGQPMSKNMMKNITLMGQKHYLFKTTVFNNIAYPLRLRKVPETTIQDKVNEIMDRLQLFGLKDQLATTLSGGESQKVALARALIFEPQLLLLDEPTANIDPDSMALIEKVIIDRHHEKKGTTIMITHNKEQAVRLCDDVLMIEQGRLGNQFDIPIIKENSYVFYWRYSCK